MGKFDEYLERAKDLAEDAGDMAKNFAEDVVDRAKDLVEEGGKVRALKQNAKEHAAAISFGAKEKVQGVLKDAKAAKELKQGIAELEALPEIEGSIIYKMELEALINDLSSLLLIISDDRLDDASVAEEVRKVMDKVQPAADSQTEEVMLEITDEQQAIEKAKAISFDACTRAMTALNVNAE